MGLKLTYLPGETVLDPNEMDGLYAADDGDIEPLMAFSRK
jgi:hypothetical protein